METRNGISVRYALAVLQIMINSKKFIQDVKIVMHSEHMPHVDSAISLLNTTDLKGLPLEVVQFPWEFKKISRALLGPRSMLQNSVDKKNFIGESGGSIG